MMWSGSVSSVKNQMKRCQASRERVREERRKQMIGRSAASDLNNGREATCAKCTRRSGLRSLLSCGHLWRRGPVLCAIGYVKLEYPIAWQSISLLSRRLFLFQYHNLKSQYFLWNDIASCWKLWKWIRLSWTTIIYFNSQQLYHILWNHWYRQNSNILESYQWRLECTLYTMQKYFVSHSS